MEKKKEKTKEAEVQILVGTRGRIFSGQVIKKFHKRVVIETERNVYVKKYERFYKKKTRIHARLPEALEKDIQPGDYIQIQECRPLSKIIHHLVIKKIRSPHEVAQK